MLSLQHLWIDDVVLSFASLALNMQEYIRFSLLAPPSKLRIPTQARLYCLSLSSSAFSCLTLQASVTYLISVYPIHFKHFSFFNRNTQTLKVASWVGWASMVTLFSVLGILFRNNQTYSTNSGIYLSSVFMSRTSSFLRSEYLFTHFFVVCLSVVHSHIY